MGWLQIAADSNAIQMEMCNLKIVGDVLFSEANISFSSIV